jgi:hypothetical protein
MLYYMNNSYKLPNITKPFPPKILVPLPNFIRQAVKSLYTPGGLMKMRLKVCKSISILIAIMLATAIIPQAALADASHQPSSWAVEKTEMCKTVGIIPDGFEAKPYTESITRRDFFELVINTCRLHGAHIPELPAVHPFKDTTDPIVEQAYMLGLTKGTAKGIFSPDLPLTREMAATVLSKVRILFQENSDSAYTTPEGIVEYKLPMDEQQAAWLLNEYSSDADQVSGWARIYMADLYSLGIIAGIGNRKLDPRGKITREQAAVLSLNTLAYCDESFRKESKIPFTFEKKELPSELPVEESWTNENERITGRANRDQFASRGDAERNMEKITIKVWNLSESGEKISASRTLVVNRNYADDVKKIFEEIYNGKDKFPIKSVSCYSYRDGNSQHSNGTAIDINPTENYFILRNGKIAAGSFWKPGDNPYSITPNGDVVRAFNKYGWKWSPDMNWPNGKDYMHFSVLGI